VCRQPINLGFTFGCFTPRYYSTQCEIGLFVAETLTRMSVDEEKANEVRNLIISVIMILQFVQGTAKDL